MFTATYTVYCKYNEKFSIEIRSLGFYQSQSYFATSQPSFLFLPSITPISHSSSFELSTFSNPVFFVMPARISTRRSAATTEVVSATVS